MKTKEEIKEAILTKEVNKLCSDVNIGIKTADEKRSDLQNYVSGRVFHEIQTLFRFVSSWEEYEKDETIDKTMFACCVDLEVKYEYLVDDLYYYDQQWGTTSKVGYTHGGEIALVSSDGKSILASHLPHEIDFEVAVLRAISNYYKSLTI